MVSRDAEAVRKVRADRLRVGGPPVPPACVIQGLRRGGAESRAVP